MTFVFINPNSTAAMTEQVLAMARAAQPGALFEGWTSTHGPAAIQGPEDGAAAVPPLLDLVAKADRAGAAGVAIACFDDTGLNEARRLARCPVIGIGQAAYHIAALRGWRFSVVTTLSVSVPIIEANIRGSGLGGHLGRVRASEVPVLDLEHDPDAAFRRIADEAARAAAEDGIDAVVLGCAGMARLTGHLRAALPVPVIDGVESAARLLAAL
ncbi:aspartate/glutamate racemase family protein [Rhodovulum strictum]|uniref:HyuE hydantoin racemase n=1 Tax=Rhodovulum strictum TaxID=58314 RepID=A0A844BDK9_9RHOB|nr:aspartate/glutamate racemase family protein [Rhodovulum strictum]MRH20688.1 HyuE hydantoin racemase [Rhodovulum strictum]